jgi:hypothetical protein
MIVTADRVVALADSIPGFARGGHRTTAQAALTGRQLVAEPLPERKRAVPSGDSPLTIYVVRGSLSTPPLEHGIPRQPSEPAAQQ